MKWIKKAIFPLAVISIIASSTMVTQTSCNKETLAAVDSLLGTDLSSLASYLVDDEKLDSIPQDLDIIDSIKGLPTSVDLTSKFPPIGNQGQYGTCVAWAAGYNLKTALNGIDKGYTASQLAQPANQASPKDLFWSLSSSDKGASCGGTYFEAALGLMVERGVATLDVVPYTNMGDCSSSSSSWASAAANNKLANYRKIADSSDPTSMTVTNFKGYLAEGRPIVFGAKLGDRFMSWNSSDVLSSDTYLQEGMQHAYHALILAGYDDSRQAFRVINSWGADWGDKGMIWVDYNFFLSSFCYAAFVAQNKATASISGSTVDPSNILSGNDLMAYKLIDEDDPESSNPLDRAITYNVYNSGTTTISASQKWSILYLYYNAFDANDYNIIIQDYYTNEYGSYGEYENWADGLGISENCWNYFDIPSGKSVASVMFNDDSAAFSYQYTMPKLTGEYYLVLYADGLEAIKEANEDNNFYFFSRSDGKPFKYVNGIIQNPETSRKSIRVNKNPARFSNTETQTLVKPGNMNTYSPYEIYKKLQVEKKSGRLQEKVNAYMRSKSTKHHSKKKGTM
jgi:hypothetical protein